MGTRGPRTKSTVLFIKKKQLETNIIGKFLYYVVKNHLTNSIALIFPVINLKDAKIYRILGPMLYGFCKWKTGETTKWTHSNWVLLLHFSYLWCIQASISAASITCYRGEPSVYLVTQLSQLRRFAHCHRACSPFSSFFQDV